MNTGTATAVQRWMYWYIPIAMMLGNFLYWPLVRGTSVAYPFFVAMSPLLFGLFGVGLATRRWKVWIWHLSYVHVAFLYSAYAVQLPLFLNDTIAQPYNALSVLKAGVLCGLLNYLTGTVFDVHSLDEGGLLEGGLLEVPNSTKESIVKSVSNYNFTYFGWLGFCVGIQSKIAYHYLVELGQLNLTVPLTAVFAAFMSVTVVAYCAIGHFRRLRARAAGVPAGVRAAS